MTIFELNIFLEDAEISNIQISNLLVTPSSDPLLFPLNSMSSNKHKSTLYMIIWWDFLNAELSELFRCPLNIQACIKKCLNMPKWHGFNFGQGDPQELKTTKKLYTSQISRLTLRSLRLLGIFQITTLTLYVVRDSEK